MFTRMIALLLITLASTTLRADVPGVQAWSAPQDLETVYDSVYKSLEDNRFFVVFEPNIGRNLAGFAERWGKDYNRNDLGGIRSMVFCNAWYANQVSNLEPQLLSLCPLHLSVYRQADMTHVVFTRPSVIANGTAAESLVQELEADVVKAVGQGIEALDKN